MRRVGLILLAFVAAVAMVAPDVSAQPQVTITGLVDNVSSWTNNMSGNDLNLARTSDDEWYGRTRVRPTVTAEVATTKFVLGLEIDGIWGQTGATDGSFGGAGPQRFGATSGFDANTDVAGVIETKWAYTEFRLPFVPFATVMRVGAQPWAALYKGGVLATGDFAGVHLTTQWSPIIKTNLTYDQIEESSTGVRDGFIRGEDYAIIASVEVTPFKGLDIRPLYAFANYIGVTSGASRQARGGLGTGAAIFPTGPAGSAEEHRHTAGVDARWRFGAFSLDPTVFYQFGHRDQVTGGVLQRLARDAWFVDLRGGWRAGPLLLEAIGVYTTGNEAEDRIDLGQSRLKFYEPISTDNTFFAGWTEVLSSGIDYFNRLRHNAAGLNTGVGVGYDKYGMIRTGLRANYALTPAFTLRAMASASWTAEEVDTSSNVAAGTGVTVGDAAGDSRYYGTELNLGFQWKFAPNVAFDLVGTYFFTGDALSANLITHSRTGVATNGRDPEDFQTISTRVRYTF